LKILVPHDGSSVSDKALRKAILFAKKLNYEILLLHIIDLKLLQTDSILKYINKKAALDKAKTQILKYLKAGSESMLKSRIEAANKEGVNIRFTLGIGSAPEGIVNVAKSEKVDFIIIGSRGLSSSDREPNKLRILGSVARNVSELAECPVMIVK
jgi:nucleotide-binding universal stress UspA family protein